MWRLCLQIGSSANVQPELYRDLSVSTGQEVDTRELRFDEKGV